jgi:hypothetical protein
MSNTAKQEYLGEHSLGVDWAMTSMAVVVAQ